MGEVKHLKCKSCGKEWNINVGFGMLHGAKEYVIKGFSDRMRDKAANAIQNESIPPYGFSMAVCSCKACGEYVSVPTIRTKTATVIDVCPKCSGDVEVAPEKLQGLKCPSCGGDVEASDSTMLWD